MPLHREAPAGVDGGGLENHTREQEQVDDGPILTADRRTDHIGIGEARCFLDLIVPGAKLRRLAFQTFDDRKKDGRLAHTLFGPFDDVAEQLVELNRCGAGVFVAPNEFQVDAERRTDENVVAARACWVDLDGAPLQPVLGGPLEPHVVTETSPGRYHAFWRAPMDVELWRAVQAAIWERFDGDPSQGKPCGVVRLPGFFHQKGERHRVRILRTSDHDDWRLADMLSAFDARTQPQRRFAEPVVGTIEDGGRNVALTRIAGKMRDFGCCESGIYAMLSAENAERCDPPLPDREVRDIVKSVMRYPVGKAWWAVGEAEDAAAEAWAETEGDAFAAWAGDQ